MDELEKALSDLAQRAVGAARQVVEKAAEADQGRYAPAEYQSAKRALDTAVTALADKNYAAAIETAARAGEAGQEAYAAATLAHAREKLEAASGEAAAGRAAGAESFAPQLLAAGESAQSEAAALVAEESGEAALAAAERALTSFSGARLFKIRAAEAARAAAETAQAPSLEAAAFAAADQTLAAAREAMDAHRYDEANRLADQAAAQFASAESRSWERRVAELAPQAEGEIAFLTNNLAVQYATDYFRPALDAFLDMRGNRAAGLYKEAYAAGERCLVEAGKARGQLEASLESVVARETRRLEQLGEIVSDEVGIAMAESGRAAGRTAVVTRRTGDLRASFVAYENLSKALDGAVAQVVTRNRQVMYAQRKAQLDAWRATGAEPLAAATFKSLSEQIESLLAGPAPLANNERIRGADQQIAAELDVMEETIRLSTEQMLAETRSNLESAAQEGGGRIFPNRFMRAEAAWRQAGDMPKGRNYPEVAAAVVDARNQSIELVEAIRLYRAEGVYRTAAYREIDNANNLLKKFAYVIEVGPLGWRTAQSSHRADLFAGVQRIISASEFYLTAQTLEQRVKDMTPPPTMVKLHALVVQSFEELTLTGELFQKYGDYTYGTESRRKFIEAAFDHYHKREKLMLEVDRLMLEGTRVEEAFRYDQPTAVRRADDFLTRLQQKSRGIEKMLGNLIWGYEL
ncbi:hypothetical protein HS125_12555 [bacterium]|nr:hypothetical protein [bacterium]